MNNAAFKIVRVKNPLWLVVLLPLALLALLLFAAFLIFSTAFPGVRPRLSRREAAKPVAGNEASARKPAVIDAEFVELTSSPATRSVSADL